MSAEKESGKTAGQEAELVRLAGLAKKFNYEQYIIEHADANASLIVEAGAGTARKHSGVNFSACPAWSVMRIYYTLCARPCYIAVIYRITAKNVPIYVPSSMQKLDANLDTVFEDMQKLGEIFGVKDKADAWVKSEQDKLASVQGKIEKLPKKKIFVYDASDGKPFTAFKGYTTNILKLIGAENVMENAGVDKTWAAVSWENVVAADPEYIIIADYSNGVRNDDDFQQKVAAIKGNPQLANVTAVKENHFVKVKLSEITPGVRTVDALVRMAEEIHGISVK